MPTLLYAPGVEVVIETAKHGVIDVSADLASGFTTLTENSPHSMSIVLTNHRRKYDGIFTPNDRFVIRMKRIAWMQVMSGYLNQVPYFSIYPRNIVLSGTCTLKRVKFRFWDAGTSEAYNLLFQQPNGNGRQNKLEVDGGIRDKLIRVLTEVADWDRRKIHIGHLPGNWFKRASSLYDQVSDQISVSGSAVGESGVVGGANPLSQGSGAIESSIPGTGILPRLSGTGTWFGGPRDDSTRGGHMALTGERGEAPKDQWYCAMRWPYAYIDRNTQRIKFVVHGTDLQAALGWWKNRRILVYNPENHRAVVLRVADWGPFAANRTIDMSEHALHTVLKAKDNKTVLQIRFAPDGWQPGPVRFESLPFTDDVPRGRPAQIKKVEPSVIEAASGLRFTSAAKLQPHVNAARQFVKQSWNRRKKNGQPQTEVGGYSERNIAGTNTLSDHALGLALDVVIADRIGKEPSPDQIRVGNSIVDWLISNPDAFGTKYVVWDERIISRGRQGEGWRPYRLRDSGVTQAHRDHIHISFEADHARKIGPMGNGWTKGIGKYRRYEAATGPIDAPTSGDSGDQNLLNTWQWYDQPNPLSETLFGARARLNDTPLLQTVAMLANASMRSFMSAPNGDFIAWFPDYFGQYGTAAKMKIEDIELMNDGFTVQWSDENMVTHQYTAGSPTGYGGPSPVPGGPVNPLTFYQTMGVATVEFPEVMESLLNIDVSDPVAAAFLDAESWLNRFGARPNFTPMGTLTGPEAEFWYALYLFQENWAKQFSSQVDLTFMPEVYPGMLLNLTRFGFQAYVEQVTHTFNLGPGGGFQTTVRIVAPSANDGSGLFGLARAR